MLAVEGHPFASRGNADGAEVGKFGSKARTVEVERDSPAEKLQADGCQTLLMRFVTFI